MKSYDEIEEHYLSQLEGFYKRQAIISKIQLDSVKNENKSLVDTLEDAKVNLVKDRENIIKQRATEKERELAKDL
jgi:hypothetical protein